jgi:hypothetical protein
LKIRNFTDQDAEFCYRVRNRAYRVEFRHELSPQQIAAATSAYPSSNMFRTRSQGPHSLIRNSAKVTLAARAGPQSGVWSSARIGRIHRVRQTRVAIRIEQSKEKSLLRYCAYSFPIR